MFRPCYAKKKKIAGRVIVVITILATWWSNAWGLEPTTISHKWVIRI
jgi:hypothetical protein